ncbi:MAG: hypothetical protein D3922_11565, partial [Candidatus Electrothrix sp. AR1]|nr:hypothetical protein [Candidatus Electrothrix sp. AR1]
MKNTLEQTLPQQYDAHIYQPVSVRNSTIHLPALSARYKEHIPVTSEPKYISVRGARMHNLKNISVDL